MSLEGKLEKYKSLIFLLELAGLLHDTGKLDSRFIDYRRKWQKNIDGWNYNNDPHDDKNKPYFDNDLLLKKPEFEQLFSLLSKPLSEICKEEEFRINSHSFNLSISLKDIMHQHTRAKDDSIALFLKLGDSIDSAYDRNNPLLSAEQKDGKEIYRATVFGYETPLNVDAFDIARERLYCQLNFLLPYYFIDFSPNIREKIFDAVEHAFSMALTDTCRPVNDIPLWQHAYVTSALCKVFFLHLLIYGEKLKDFEACKFSLCGFGWDGLSFLSKGHKIGDIMARKQLIHDLKESIKEVIEHKYPIGMNIYDDDNGISFVIPAILEDNKSKAYKELLDKIEEEVIEVSNNVTGGEVYPVCERGKETHYIMEIINIIESLRKNSYFPFSSDKGYPLWIDSWKEDREVCNVCQKRPLEPDKTVCDICEERRTLAQRLREERESIFNEEIADENGRICLIVAKFNLLPWLSGDMLWTLFVKESHSLKDALCHLGEIKDFEESDKERKTRIEEKLGDIEKFKYNYEKIKRHIDKCINSTIEEDKRFAEGIGFLFDRHTREIKDDFYDKLSENLNRLKDKWLDKRVNREITIDGKTIKERFEVEADIYSYLLTKNHTPSRLLNIWNTTRAFLRDLFQSDEIKREKLPPFRRVEVSFSNSVSSLMPLNNACYEALIGGRKREIFRQDEEVFIVNLGGEEIKLENERNWLDVNKEVIIYPNEFEKSKTEKKTEIVSVHYSENSFYPYRVITYSPDLLMVLVPAEKALDISLFIYEEYMNHFGKVIGRLPLSIGNIFFQKKTPMFVVLDAGRRMEENFRKLYENYWEEGKKRELRVVRKEVEKTEEDKEEKTKKIILEDGIELNLAQFLGNGKLDYFHPYFIVGGSEGKDYKNRRSYFETFLGDLVHFSEVKEEDIITFYPGYYDFEFLDSTTRRYDIFWDEATNFKRRSNVTQLFSKPYLLDELEHKIVKLWKGIKGKDGKDKSLMPEITDTKLRNIESLWLSKLQEWKVDISIKESKEFEEWANLVEATLKKEFSKYLKLGSKEDKDDFEWLKEVIHSGLFFDCLELYLRILKERIKG